MSRDWIIQPPYPDLDQTAAHWNIPPLLAQLLLNRGVATADQARAFMNPQLAGLSPVDTLPGATEAARLIVQAVRAQKRIVVYGDYDVDGITATAILWRMLRLIGAQVTYYVPHRIDEGYGLNTDAVTALADDGADMIITVDCGINSPQAAQLARKRGLQLIITDHHPFAATPDHANVVVHPRIGGDTPRADTDLSGAGVAFKLAWAIGLTHAGGDRVSPQARTFLTHALSLAALGTIADIVPLTGDNRILARAGLARIRSCTFEGIKALLEQAGLSGNAVRDEDVAFKLAPRINAAGRMGHARLAIELLTLDEPARAREISAYLDDHNRARQSIERKLTRVVCEQVEKNGMAGDAHRAIVVAGENWHAGVIGIVAAKVVDRYRKPAVVICLDNGTGQGSARSVPGFALHDALDRCDDHLISHGGHAMAAGLRIRSDAVDAFTDAFVRIADNTLSGAALRPKLRLDGITDLAQLDYRTALSITNLGPFGQAHPRPRFATGFLELAAEPRCVGKNANHLQLTLSQDGAVMKGIAFRAADKIDALQTHRRCRVAFEPIINTFRGQSSVELQIVDFKFPDE